MPPTLHALGLDSLGPDDRLAVAQALWDSLSDEVERRPPTPAQRAELDRRVALADADPSRGRPWDEVLAAARARWGK